MFETADGEQIPTEEEIKKPRRSTRHQAKDILVMEETKEPKPSKGKPRKSESKALNDIKPRRSARHQENSTNTEDNFSEIEKTKPRASTSSRCKVLKNPILEYDPLSESSVKNTDNKNGTVEVVPENQITLTNSKEILKQNQTNSSKRSKDLKTSPENDTFIQQQ